MDVRKKLVELLGNIYLPMMCGPDTIGEYRIPHKFKKEIANHLIAHGVTVQEWISVKERLPALHLDDYQEPDGSRMQFEVSEDQWVITKTGYQTKARYETGVVFQGWVDDFGGTIRDVTHWMPLPQPPEGE